MMREKRNRARKKKITDMQLQETDLTEEYRVKETHTTTDRVVVGKAFRGITDSLLEEEADDPLEQLESR